jgi:hypothetical protein
MLGVIANMGGQVEFVEWLLAHSAITTGDRPVSWTVTRCGRGENPGSKGK